MGLLYEYRALCGLGGVAAVRDLRRLESGCERAGVEDHARSAARLERGHYTRSRDPWHRSRNPWSSSGYCFNAPDAAEDETDTGIRTLCFMVVGLLVYSASFNIAEFAAQLEAWPCSERPRLHRGLSGAHRDYWDFADGIPCWLCGCLLALADFWRTT